MKILNLIKTLVFAIAGILTICFHDFLFEIIDCNLNIFVGAIIVLFSIEPIILLFVKNERHEFLSNLLKGSLTFCFGLLMMLLVKTISSQILLACVIWGVWSILRELEEIRSNISKKIKTTPVCALLNILESVAVIVLTIIFIVGHNPQGVNFHLYILGVELVLESLWPFAYKLEIILKNRK